LEEGGKQDGNVREVRLLAVGGVGTSGGERRKGDEKTKRKIAAGIPGWVTAGNLKRYGINNPEHESAEPPRGWKNSRTPTGETDRV